MIEKRKLSMPFWCVGNPVGDPFGPGVMDEVSAFEIADIIAQAAIWDAAAEVARTMASGDPAGIAALKIDHDAVAKAPIRIGELDHPVNRKIFGI